MSQPFENTVDPRHGAERVARLREALRTAALDGFVVPRSDVHQNEYVPPSEERLAWLTGFSGSAGLAVVLADKATIFVDGRYTVQVREQVDAAVFAPRHLIEEPPERWLAGELKAGRRLGYDPRLHTLAEADRLKGAAEGAGAELVPVEANPVDAVWTDRPAPPLAAVVLHDEALAGEAATAKIARLQARLAELKADAVFTNDAHAVAWAFNIRGADVAHTPLPLSFVLVPSEGRPTLFVDGRKLSNAVRTELHELADIAEPGNLDRMLGQAAKGRTIRLDPNGVVQHFSDVITQAGGTIQRGPDPVALFRAVKSQAEQAGARAAHHRDGVAMARFLAWFSEAAPRGGETEISAADALERFRQDTGLLKELSFPSISAAGPNAALPHYHATPASNRRIGPGLYLIDSGAQFLDGTTDITRTIAVGEPDAEMRDRYTRVLKGHIAIARAVFPRGASGAQLDTLARKPLWDIGADFDHGTGHGIGSYLSVHEGPQRISKLGFTVLEPGMMLSNEPGYYREGAFGIRIENLLIVQAIDISGAERPMLGFETISLAPIDTTPIEPSLLDAGEIAWLDAYHARVRETLSPLVDEATRTWLEGATQPLPG